MKKSQMTYPKQFKNELLNALRYAAQSKHLLDEYLTDLLTPTEYREITARWQVVKQLFHKIPQRQISKSLKIGIATITRGSRELQNPKGGFNKLLSTFYDKR